MVRSPYTLRFPAKDPFKEVMLGAVTDAALRLDDRNAFRQLWLAFPTSYILLVTGTSEVANDPTIKSPVAIFVASREGTFETVNTPSRFDACPEIAIADRPLNWLAGMMGRFEVDSTPMRFEAVPDIAMAASPPMPVMDDSGMGGRLEASNTPRRSDAFPDTAIAASPSVPTMANKGIGGRLDGPSTSFNES
jgi:hypothetical protein